MSMENASEEAGTRGDDPAVNRTEFWSVFVYSMIIGFAVHFQAYGVAAGMFAFAVLIFFVEISNKIKQDP